MTPPDPRATVSPTRLGLLDRLLPLWIFLAMAAGLVLGRTMPTLGPSLDRLQVAGVSFPIAVGLLAMMYPVLARVRYETIGHYVGDPRLLGTSLVLNWLVGPVVMFALAWVLLPDLPAYRNGLVIVGLARCIAMVLIWNTLAAGSGELAAVLVALNSLFQVLAYSVLGYFYLQVVPRWLGAEGTALAVDMGSITRSVVIFLGIPLAAGYLTRKIALARRGLAWYEEQFLRRVGPIALLGLLYTIILMFAMQGDRILARPLDVARVALPLLGYFAVMFTIAFAWSRRLGFSHEDTVAVSFTAAGNNFELAIAVAIGTFGITSGEAVAAVVGPLIEVPALVGLVYVALWARRFFPRPPSAQAEPQVTPMPPAGPRFRILFLCTGNSARSQIAEALLSRKGLGRFEAASVGSAPAARINPLAIQVLAEGGIPWEGKSPRGFEALQGQAWDFVITVCDRAREACPIFPGTPVLAHWGMPDPAEVTGTEDARLGAFRESLATLTRRIDLLLALPLEKLGRLVLERRIAEIGQQ